MHKSYLFLSLACTSALLANPSGGSVQAGDVSMQTFDNTLEIHASDRSIIHWDDFSISMGETTRFIQPSASSAVLNRVTGMSQSMINGLLEANGRVILLNPHGVLIGKEGVIKTSEFIASNIDILNLSDWSVRRDGQELALEGCDARALIHHEGMIEATGIERSEGRILLLGPDLKIDGQLVAHAGSIELLGEHILLDQNTNIDVSSPHAGGSVLVGGDFQGKNREVMNSKTVGMHRDAIITASATEEGLGGRVILWSEEGTDFRGSISTRGSDQGFIEISSKGSFIYQGHTDGNLLLDPCDITINAGPSAPVFTFPLYVPGGASATINANDIQGALVGGNNVTIQTTSVAANPGFITWQPGFPIAWATNNSLQLDADSDINIGSDITCTGSGNITLNAPTGNIKVTSGGATSSVISTTGSGVITLAGQSATITASTLVGGVSGLTTAGGAIHVTATTGSIQVGDATASDATTIATTTGAINLTAATGVDVTAGIVTAASAKVVTGAITAPININVNGTGNVQIVSTAVAPGLVPIARIGDDANPCGPVTINVANGDLNMLVGDPTVGGSHEIHLASQDSINIKARHMTVLADGVGVPLAFISVNNGAPTTSSIQLSGDFLARAIGVLGQAPRFRFAFPNSTLSFSCAGNFRMTNSAIGVFTGFYQLGGLGSVNFNIGGDFRMTVNQGFVPFSFLYFSTTIPLQMNVGGDFLVSSQGQTFAQLISNANLNLHVGGNVVTQGGVFTAGTAVGINSLGTDTFNIFAGGDIHMRPRSNYILADSGAGVFIANNNIIFDHSTNIIPIAFGGPQLSLTLVADNQFPSAPLIGPGAFIMDAGSTIFPFGVTGTPPVRIFTARQAQNNIAGVINGVTFVPGPFNVNTSSERWSVYYPQNFGGFPFTVFYKEPFFLPPRTFLRLYAVLGNMYDVLSEFEYPLPFYKEEFCLYYCSEDAAIAEKECWSKYPGSRNMIITNDSCYPVQMLNYRKFHPYRPKSLQMDID